MFYQYLEAFLILSQNNKGLLTYERGGNTVFSDPQSTPEAVAAECTILGVEKDLIPPQFRFINPVNSSGDRFRLDPKTHYASSVKTLYKWIRDKGEVSITGKLDDKGTGSMLNFLKGLMRSFTGKNVLVVRGRQVR